MGRSAKIRHRRRRRAERSGQLAALLEHRRKGRVKNELAGREALHNARTLRGIVSVGAKGTTRRAPKAAVKR
jgi:hypothetical protein